MPPAVWGEVGGGGVRSCFPRLLPFHELPAQKNVQIRCILTPPNHCFFVLCCFLLFLFWGGGGGGGGYDDGFEQLVVWTASGKPLADAVLDRLDLDRNNFSHRLCGEACTRYGGLYIKDVRRLGRPMHSVVVLDNSVYSFGLTLDNGVSISPWTGNKMVTAPVFHSEQMLAVVYLKRCLFWFLFGIFWIGEGLSSFASFVLCFIYLQVSQTSPPRLLLPFPLEITKNDDDYLYQTARYLPKRHSLA